MYTLQRQKRMIGRCALATALFVALLTGAVPTRAAGPPSGQFVVKATVNLACSATSTQNISFGNHPSPVDSDVPGRGIITVDCPVTVFPIWIALSEGTGTGATFAQRRMTSSIDSADTVVYSLYTAAGKVWGDGSNGSEKLETAGAAAPATHDVFGVIPKGQVPVVGTYFDTIMVTLSF
ncbi:MAG: spore coat U domain-containing protein [Betaproteobacteria bacterium]